MPKQLQRWRNIGEKGKSGHVQYPNVGERTDLTTPMRGWWTASGRIIGGKWFSMNVGLSGRVCHYTPATGKVWWHDTPGRVTSMSMKMYTMVKGCVNLRGTMKRNPKYRDPALLTLPADSSAGQVLEMFLQIPDKPEAEYMPLSIRKQARAGRR